MKKQAAARNSWRNSASYGWLMVAMFAMVNFLVSFCQFQPGYFSQEIMAYFSLTAQDFTLMTMFPTLVGLLLALVTGSLADRFGLRRTVLLALVITAIGGIARAWCTSYILLLICSATLGIGATFIAANMAKLTMLWCAPGRIAMALGIIAGANAAGMSFAQAVTGVIFDSFQTAFFWGGVLMAVIAVIWAIFGRDKQVDSELADAILKGVEDTADAKASTSACSANEPQPKKRGLRDVIGCAGLWEAGFGAAFYNAYTVTSGSFLATALVLVNGVDPVLAGIEAALFSAVTMVGSVAMPAFAVKFKHAKALCITLPIVSMGVLLWGFFGGSDILRCVLFPLGGLLFGGLMPMFMSYPSILPQVNNENSGAAGGFVTTLSMIGSSLMPSFVITPLAGGDYAMIIVIAAIIGALMTVPFALLPSLYRKN